MEFIVKIHHTVILARRNIMSNACKEYETAISTAEIPHFSLVNTPGTSTFSNLHTFEEKEESFAHFRDLGIIRNLVLKPLDDKEIRYTLHVDLYVS